jgi:hypothetical protein
MISEVLKEFTRNWTEIENLIEWNFDQEYLIDLDSNKEDICEKKPLETCLVKTLEDDNDCVLYKKKKCVNSERRQIFGIGARVESQINKQNKFKVVDAIFDEYVPPSIGFRFFESEYFKCYILKNNNNLYFLLSVGNIRFDIYESEECKEFIKKIINNIKTYYTNEQIENIILCGHSQGCVISQYIGLMIIKDNEAFFTEKIWIVGSGPFHWIHVEDKVLFESHKDKICIFVLKCTITNKYMYDPYSIKNFVKKMISSESVIMPDKVMYILDALIENNDASVKLENVIDKIGMRKKVNASISITEFIEKTKDAVLDDESSLIKQYGAIQYGYPVVENIYKNFHTWMAYRFFFNLWLNSDLPPQDFRSESTSEKIKRIDWSEVPDTLNPYFGGQSRSGVKMNNKYRKNATKKYKLYYLQNMPPRTQKRKKIMKSRKIMKKRKRIKYSSKTPK